MITSELPVDFFEDSCEEGLGRIKRKTVRRQKRSAKPEPILTERPVVSTPPILPPITLTPTPTSVVTNVTLPDTTTLPKSQKRSWYEKTVDAILTYHKNKFDRDIAIAQANGQIREPEVNQEQIRHVRPLETFGAEFGRTTEDLADFLRRNILVVGLVTLGVILFLRDPKKGK